MPLPEIGIAMEQVRDVLKELADSDETPEAILPAIEQSIETLEKALKDQESVELAVGIKAERLLEQVELIQKYKDIQQKAADLEIDLPTALKQQDIEWPEDEGDLVRNQSEWFPILRRSIPKAQGVVKDLAKEMAWQRDERKRV